ncbi:hypothetical protein D9M71_619370 [compost metagenome]
MIHVAVDQYTIAIAGLEAFTAQDVLLDGLIDLFEVEVVNHQLMFVGQLKTAEGEMPAELRRHLRRQVPAAAMTRHREGIGLPLPGPGPVIADGLIAVVAEAGQFEVERLTPGIGAGPFAE